MKLLNLTYNDPKRWEEVKRIAGADVPFFKSIRMGGTGSPKAELVKAPKEVEEVMSETSERNTCNVEMRSSGFVIRFRSRLETMALVCGMQEVKEVSYALLGDSDLLDIRFELTSGDHIVLRSNGFNAGGWDRFLKRYFEVN